MKASPLTPVEQATIDMIERHDTVSGPITQAGIARYFNVTSATISLRMKGLAAKGALRVRPRAEGGIELPAPGRRFKVKPIEAEAQDPTPEERRPEPRDHRPRGVQELMAMVF